MSQPTKYCKNCKKPTWHKTAVKGQHVEIYCNRCKTVKTVC